MKSTKKSRTEWLELVRAWEGSGQRQGAFCADRELSLATFSYWRGQYLREQGVPAGFVALRAKADASVVKLRLGGLEVELSAEADFVADVLVKLARRC